MWGGIVVTSTIRNTGKLLQASIRLHRLPKVITAIDFHTTSQLVAKLFVDKENKFAHDVLEQSLKSYQIFRLEPEISTVSASLQSNGNVDVAPKLPALVLNEQLTSSEVTSDEVFKNFCALVHYCAHSDTLISDARFRHFTTKVFCDAFHKLSDEQVIDTLRQIAHLPVEPSVKSPNFVELWNCIDIECCRRLDGWHTDQLLLISDAWYSLRLARVCDFVWGALRKLGRKVRRMRPEQLVQAMFLCNVVRRPIFEMFEFEVNLARCVEDMTLQELGVMSMGFFKTQTPIRNPELLEHLYKRLQRELDTVEDITLVSILKVLRYSSKLPQVSLVMELLDALSTQVERISLLSCLHVALLGSDLQCCHDEILELLLQRFNRNLEQARLKDLERICFVIGVFNYRSPTGVDETLCLKIVPLLRTKIDEIMKHPRCFPNCLHFLAVKGHYDAEMISSVLDMQFIRHAYGKNLVMGREIFHLDSFVKINLKDANYEGNQIAEKYRRTMGKLLTNYIPERNPKYKLNATDRVLMEIKETTNRILRLNTIKHILPHFERPDVVVCYDNQQRKPIPLSAECPEDYTGFILTRKELLGDMDLPHIDTIAIVVAGWNNVVREKQRNTGLFDMKLKQLQLLGHKYIVIYWHEWRELETPTDRQNFIKRKLVKIINL